VKRHRYYDECNNLGVTQMLLERYGDAAESYRCALEDRPGAAALFNHAEALKLAGDTQQADREFRGLIDSLRAQRSSRTGVERMLEIQGLAHLARSDATLAAEALELTERVLAESPGAPSRDVLYTAATAFSLLGDERRAAEYVSKALDGGREASWFRYPWFDGVRRRPELEQRLTYRPPATTCKR
jgi:tetratricopeptide (TPR) repeat protein